MNPQNNQTPYPQGQPLPPQPPQAAAMPNAPVAPAAPYTQISAPGAVPQSYPGQPVVQNPVQQTQTPTTIASTSPNNPPVDNTPKIVENPLSTQSTLMISELRDGIVIMKDGSFRAVVACQSINFDLMSAQEREGVEYNYKSFLNSLNFTIQILIRSQRINIGPYIEHLIDLRRNNDNMLLGVLMDDYINFIDILSQSANIMDTSFFVVIPYYSSADAEALVQGTKNLFKTFGRKKTEVTRINRDTYNKAVDELNNRVDTITAGLFDIGIRSVRLNTRELSELYYNFNNPDTAVRQPLVDFSKIATTYVRKGVSPNE